MKVKLCLLFFTLASLLIVGFSAPNKEIADKFLLDIVAQYQCLPVFNYAAKMAAVDVSPYIPGQPKYAHTTLFKSTCSDTAAHGGKVFGLYVKNDNPYAYDLVQPEGQTLVMVTWNWEEIRASKGNDKMVRTGDSTFLKPTTPSDFFIMYKAGNRGTVSTDSGWLYARVTANGNQVLQKGLVSRCMNCHDQSKADRMMGAR